MKISSLFALIGVAESRTSEGKCPKVKYMKNFDQRKFVGHWYSIETDKRNRYSRGGNDCGT